ncbi:MAG TPA: molybdopterin-dependent oxidoreductase [Candidatus Dormibacteraeota bacterium]|nr:molybdopterin-dependent oxidoreductase [Candidatus Dormibacteraeota bacterium]
MAVLDSVCPLDCPDTCSLSVTVEEGRLTRVDGSRRNPLTDGFICAKVRHYPERVYSPLRVLHPQRRVGARGEGRFARIGWDEAIALIAERFRAVVAEHGAEAILPYHYGGSNGLLGDNAADARFFARLGASQLLTSLCAMPTGAAHRAMYGAMPGVPPADYALARCIILWGVNPSATSIHLVPHVRAAQGAGAFVAVIDPRRTPLARSADLHLAPRPGTDAVLALAMIDGLVRRGLADPAQVAGLDELARAAAQWPLARAAAECDVPAADIERLIEAYAAASPAVVRCGWGLERNHNGGQAARAVLALPAVAGKFGVRGGGVTMSLSRAHPIDSARLQRLDLARAPRREINMVQLGRVLTEPIDPPIKALFVYNANPVAMTPDQNRVLAGLAREDLFTVVHEQVMTDTARWADVLLPATTIFEQTELHRAYGHYVTQYSEPVIAPLGESLTNPQVFARLGRAMGFADPASIAEEPELLADALEPGALDAVRRARALPVRFGDGTAVVQFGTVFPATPSGRVELCPPALGPVSYRPVAADGRLVLLSPASDRTINSIFGEQEVRPAVLAMHPDDARARGLRDGQAVRVFNELGEVHVPVRVSADLRRGIVTLAKGLWRKSTLNGATSTALVPDALTDIGGGACFNDARVEVAALG